MLLREVTIHIYNRLWDLVFLRIRKRSSLCGFDFEGNPEKGCGNGKKSIHQQKAEFVYLFVRERKKTALKFL